MISEGIGDDSRLIEETGYGVVFNHIESSSRLFSDLKMVLKTVKAYCIVSHKKVHDCMRGSSVCYLLLNIITSRILYIIII